MEYRQASCGSGAREPTFLRVGDVVPDFAASSTKGTIHFHRWIKGKWTVFFSHPAAFTPVCTTELGMLASVQPTLEQLGFRVVAMSCDDVAQHVEWERDIEHHFEGKVGINFPIIGDSSRDVAVKLGMVDPEMRGKDVMPLTSRTVFIIGPDGRLHLLMDYPDFVGRSAKELLRVCRSLVLCARLYIATPASWPDNHGTLTVDGKSMAGAVCVHSSISDKEVARRFSASKTFALPSGKKYMRLALVPDSPPQSTCWEGLVRCLPCGRPRGDDPSDTWSALVSAQPRYSTPSMVKLVPVGRDAKSALEKRARGMEKFACLYGRSTDGHLRHGDTMPDFNADTTRGRINFHRYIGGYWTVLYVVPRAFSPVATTELGTLALLYHNFVAKRIRVLAVSAETVPDLGEWEKDIVAHFGLKQQLQFPLVSDVLQDIASQFAVDIDDLPASGGDVPFLPRSMFIIAPDKTLKLVVSYPAEVGFDVHEILRVCDALQLSTRESIATPACWPNNHPDLKDEAGRSMQGAVFPLDTVAKSDVQSFFPQRVDVQLPSGRKYMTLAKIDDAGRMPLCAGCVSFGT